jgi:hypothetical protein
VRFLIDWLLDAPNAAPEERATACDLKILIGEQNVCLHLDGADGELYNHLTMPAYSLAEGLVYDWWKILGGRDKEYRLIKHRMGYATPDIRFRFDGAAFEAWSNQLVYANPDIRYWAGPHIVMSRLEAEDSFATFIGSVIEQLGKNSLHGTSVQLRWNRVCNSRSSADESAFCEAAGALGLDAYDVTETDAQFIERSADVFSGEPLIEFLSGLSRNSSRDQALNWIEKVESFRPYQSRLSDLASLAEQVSQDTPAHAGERAWALGYRRARATRTALDRKLTSRITSVSELAKILGNRNFRRAPPVNGLRALIARRDEHVHIHLRDRPSTPEARVSEVFSFARAVGDAICFPNTPRSVVNELHEASRQAAGRSFAAEFIAPIDEILSMQADGKDIAVIADELNVSPEVVERQIENQERIREVCD